MGQIALRGQGVNGIPTTGESTRQEGYRVPGAGMTTCVLSIWNVEPGVIWPAASAVGSRVGAVVSALVKPGPAPGAFAHWW
jgi:hypothetical protein